MSRIITYLGIVAAVCGAIASQVSLINPKAGVIVMLVGTVAAALGKEIVAPAALRRGIPHLRQGLPRRGSFARRLGMKDK